MDQHRSERVSEAIREELSEIIGYEMSDPRIGPVDVTEVLVSPDMRHARVRLHLGGDEKSREATLRALEGRSALPAAGTGEPAPPVPIPGAALRSRPGNGIRRAAGTAAEARPKGQGENAGGGCKKVR